LGSEVCYFFLCFPRWISSLTPASLNSASAVGTTHSSFSSSNLGVKVCPKTFSAAVALSSEVVISLSYPKFGTK
jgi:hypothetical protein